VDGRGEDAAGPGEVPILPRIRILFSKRGPFCFIRHVELPQIFSRAAARAGLSIELTEGFSPHPKISLGPALPVGVVACAEPAEIWFNEWRDSYLERFDDALPDGLSAFAAEFIEGKSLNKLCDAGEYIVHFPCSETRETVLSLLREEKHPWEENLLDWEIVDRSIRMVMSSPSQKGPGNIVKKLVEMEIIQGWADIRLARLSVGTWNSESKKVVPLVESASGTLSVREG